MRKVPNKQIIFFAFIGHFLELYDYTIYVVLLSVISPIFFSSNSNYDALSIGMWSFAFSLLIGPFASFFWGWYGDKHGRSPMLRKSIMIMALPSLFISILPSYNEIGVFAPTILIFCRFLQTFSASGEMNGSYIFLMEHYGLRNLGKISGALSFVGAMGVLLAMLVGLLISSYNFSWRIGFLLGGILAFLGVILRKKMSESPEFIKLTNNKTKKINTTSTLSLLKNNINQAIIVINLAAVLGILSYMTHGFINHYIENLGYSSNIAYKTNIVGLILCGIGAITTGIIIDYKYKAEKVMSYNLLSCIIFIPLSFLLINLGNISLIYVGSIMQGLLLGINATACKAIICSLFPPETRCRGVMIFYSIGMVIFGGLTPITLKLSTNFGNYTPAMIVAIACLFAYLIYKRTMEKINAMS